MKTTRFTSYPSSLAPIEQWESLPERAARTGVLVLPDGAPAPERISTRVTSCFTPGDLYVIFEGHFVSLRSIGGTDGLRGMTEGLWERSDVYEFFIGVDAQRTGRYFEFQLGPDGRYLAFAITHEGGTLLRQTLAPEEGFHCVSVIDIRGRLWRGLFRISWPLLTGDGPGEGLHCNAFRASGKFHGDELLTLSPTGYGDGCFHRYQCFMPLELLTVTPSLPRETP